MLIRVEIPIDAAGIDKLLRKVFAGNGEANLIQKLRENGLITLGIVATDDYGGIIGYAAFSPVMVNGEDRQWVGLAPLAVAEKYQEKGVGKALVYEGLDTLNEFSYAAVAVLGDPDYYVPFGFRPAAELHLHCKWPGTESAFHIYSLAECALDSVAGLVEYSALFDSLSE